MALGASAGILAEMSIVVGVIVISVLAAIAWRVLRAPVAGHRTDDPAALRSALEEAVRSGDLRAMDRICRANEQAIVDAFPTWARRDPSLGPPSRAEIDGLIQFLGTVAQHMDRALMTAAAARVLRTFG